MFLIRNPRRQVDIKGREMSGSLYAEEVCTEYVPTPHWYEDGDTIFDTGFAAALGNGEETEKMSKSLFTIESTELKTVGVTAKDGRKYVLAANFTDEDKILTADMLGVSAVKNIATGMTETKIPIAPGEAVLLQI